VEFRCPGEERGWTLSKEARRSCDRGAPSVVFLSSVSLVAHFRLDGSTDLALWQQESAVVHVNAGGWEPWWCWQSARRWRHGSLPSILIIMVLVGAVVDALLCFSSVVQLASEQRCGP
jgi:hypothetical protein